MSRKSASTPSDVDELVEVRDQVFDEARAPVGDLRPNPRHESPKRDRRNHQAAVPVATDRGWRPATRSEHPFEFAVLEPGRSTEIVDDLDDSPPNRDVTHELRRPGVDLVVTLVLE